LRKKYQEGVTILNELPEEEAFALWTKYKVKEAQIVSTSCDTDMTQRLADELSRIIRDWLRPDDLLEVLSRNRTLEPGVCATHDFCDANVAMEEAFTSALKRDFNPASIVDVELWNAARELAKVNEFPRQMKLIENAEGVPVYAFAIKDMWIDNPRLSDCGRFEVDPIEKYGLRPQEIAELENANSRLRADREAAEAHGANIPTEGTLAKAPNVTIAQIRGRYPTMEVWHSGSGCYALRLVCHGGGYLLITECEDAQIPADDATEVDVGRYSENGDILEDADTIKIEALEQWIDTALSRASNPNVADYFVMKLGVAHGDESLTTVPLDSGCGKECVKAIDAAAALNEHIRAGFGYERLALSFVVHIARQVVGVYWRG
jgi:hypothetical protein